MFFSQTAILFLLFLLFQSETAARTVFPNFLKAKQHEGLMFFVPCDPFEVMFDIIIFSLAFVSCVVEVFLLHNSFFLLLFFFDVLFTAVFKRKFMYLYFCEKKRFPLPLRKDFNSSPCRLQIFYLNLLSSSYRPEALSCLPSQWGGQEDGQETETISTFKKKNPWSALKVFHKAHVTLQKM